MNMLGVKNPPKNCFPSVKGGGDAPFSVKKFPLTFRKISPMDLGFLPCPLSHVYTCFSMMSRWLFHTQMEVLRQEVFLQKLATGMEKALKSPRFLSPLLLSLMFSTFTLYNSNGLWGTEQSIWGDLRHNNIPPNPLGPPAMVAVVADLKSPGFLSFSTFTFTFYLLLFSSILPTFWYL